MVYRLARCVWEITLACCFSCKYCGSGGGKARENELTTGECLSVADQLKELGCERVSLIGGEVFMRPDWKEIVLRLTSQGIRVNLITNGFLFTEALIQSLKDCRVESVSVSLDGPREVHDKYRQAGSYDRALRALETLTQSGIPTSVISTLNAENALLLEEFYDILKKYPIFAWQLQACSPMGNAARYGVPFLFDQRRVIAFVREHAEKAPFMLGVADNIGYFTPEEGSIRGNLSGKAYFKGCSAGISAIGIDSVGNVRDCESMYDDRFIEGNLRQESIRRIWEDPDRFAYNRKFTKDDLTGSCATCELGEYCGGGCRSYNYFVHGRMFESPCCAGLRGPISQLEVAR